MCALMSHETPPLRACQDSNLLTEELKAAQALLQEKESKVVLLEETLNDVKGKVRSYVLENLTHSDVTPDHDNPCRKSNRTRLSPSWQMRARSCAMPPASARRRRPFWTGQCKGNGVHPAKPSDSNGRLFSMQE